MKSNKIKLLVGIVGVIVILFVGILVYEKEFADKNGVQYSIVTEEIEIDIYATKNGDRFKAVFSPHTFIHTPEGVIYTKEGFKRAYFFKYNKFEEVEIPGLGKTQFPDLTNLDLGTDFLATSEIGSIYLLAYLTIGAYNDGKLINGVNSLTFSKPDDLSLTIKGLKEVSFKMDLPQDLVPFQDVILSYKENHFGARPLFSASLDLPDDSRFDKLLDEYHRTQNEKASFTNDILEDPNSEASKQERDVIRIEQLQTLKQVISLYLVSVGEPLLCPDSQTIYSSSKLTLPSGWKMGPNVGITKTNGTGWIPINLDSYVRELYLDPVNDPDQNLVYVYVCDRETNKFELNAKLESIKYGNKGYADTTSMDGGDEPEVYEVGNSYELIPHSLWE